MHARSSKRTRIYRSEQGGGGGGRDYEIKTLRSNLVPEEGGGGAFIRGGRIIEQVWYMIILQKCLMT